MDDCLIKYSHVCVKQDGVPVLEDVNVEFSKGQYIYIVGKVGTGKSSFLKTIYGELEIDEGEADVLGFDMRKIRPRRLPALRRRLGIVFQDFQLLTDRTVDDNLMFVLRATGWRNKREAKARIDEVLDQVGMANKGYKMPNELSGGEQQRVVIARAILNNPDILIADEPTGNLDAETADSIVSLLHGISDSGTLVIMTTHNLSLIDKFPGTTYVCKNHKLDLDK
ncbi:MAG TPA: ATP-binding cassette domain-containing protein [Candidatus Avibacteroides avistercoris]|uniref:ATP-binding cassette domain-containing protein n=1 Tax=Candidatus Avibacteroides avistercoris TaxID=2840690 RepID=A0A9D2ZU44_9BACT|nr:ATP-binding cassette domain-containing protein [Candidatus Avibacteroides avistercoris]